MTRTHAASPVAHTCDHHIHAMRFGWPRHAQLRDAVHGGERAAGASEHEVGDGDMETVSARIDGKSSRPTRKKERELGGGVGGGRVVGLGAHRLRDMRTGL